MPLSAHLHKLVDYDQGSVYRAAYQLKCTGNNGGNVGVSRFPSGVSQMLTKEHRKHYMQVCQDLLSRKAEDLNFLTQIREEDNISLVK